MNLFHAIFRKIRVNAGGDSADMGVGEIMGFWPNQAAKITTASQII